MTADHLQRAAAALQALDADRLVVLYANAFTLEDVPNGLVITEREGLREYFRALFGSPDTRFDGIEVFGCGDRGAARWTWSGTNPWTGCHFAIRGASIFELSADGITRETIFYDPAPASLTT